RDVGGGPARTRRAGPALILLAVVVLAAGCGMARAAPPPGPRPVPGTPPATAFVLTVSGPDENTLGAVALPGGRRLWSASIPGQTAGLVVAPRVGRAYVLAGPPFTLTPVSLSTGAVGRPIGVGPAAWSVALAPDGTTAYVVNAGTGIAILPGPDGSTITPVNLRTEKAGPAISVGNGPCGIAFTGDDTAWVSLPLAGHLTQVNLAAGRPGPSVAVPPTPRWQVAAPCVLAVASGAGLLAVGNLQQDLAFPAPVVNLLDLASHRWRRPITLPGSSSNAVDELGFSPDARHVYVSARTRGGLTDTLYIASIVTGTVTQARLTGQSVIFALTPGGGTLWVAASTGSGERQETALLPVSATTGVPGRAVAYLPGTPVAIGL
ncbi:MAG: YncE family protein, partial [Streptosporangiaceae bacterium]